MISLARSSRKLIQRTSIAVPARRSFAVSALRKEDHPPPAIIQGSGAVPGTVPTDMEQATGLERMELLAKMRGEDPFSMSPLQVDYMGTLKKPVMVFSLDNMRIVGCTGFPVDSHDTLYGRVTTEKGHRCPECGCCYAIDFHGDPHASHH